MRALGFVRCFSLALLFLAISASAFAGVFVSVTVAPPVLPVYEQPACPGDGYIWTPGYWAYGPYGYYWVPGTWVMPPTVGLYWTPGYWAWGGSAYLWHVGYWGPHVGFYGGVNYGYGYFGNGFEGGYWSGPHFYYNRTVNNINITNVHIYNRTVINNYNVTRVSYNGGRGGLEARPSHEEERWGHERHFEPTGMQRDHENYARENRGFRMSENHGRPAIAATSRPGEFRGHDDNWRDRRPDNRSVPRPPQDARRDNRPDMRGGRDDRGMQRQDARGNRDDRGNQRQDMRGGRDDRGMQRQDARGNRDDRGNQRQEMRGNQRANRPEYGGPREDPRPTTYRPENNRGDNGRGRGNGPPQERQDRGDKGHEDRGHDKH